MTVTYQFAYTALGPWTAVWNSAINLTEPTFYAVQANADGSVELFVSGPAVAGATGAGALAKGVVASPAIPFSQLTTNVLVTVDDSPARQWIEIDTRLTTADGFTYPGDMDIGLDGTVRVGDISGTWHVSPVKLAPFRPWTATPLSILKTYDFTKKTVTMFGMTFPAANIGWAPNEIVNQLQIDQAPAGGTCVACFSNISMAGS